MVQFILRFLHLAMVPVYLGGLARCRPLEALARGWEVHSWLTFLGWASLVLGLTTGTERSSTVRQLLGSMAGITALSVTGLQVDVLPTARLWRVSL